MTTSNTHTTLQTKPFNDLWNGNGVSERDEAELWTLLPSKEKVYVLIDRVSASVDNPGPIVTAAAWVQRAYLLRHLRQLSATRRPHTLTVILSAGNEDQPGLDLLRYCIKLSQKQSFNVQSMVTAKTTAEIVACLPLQSATA